MKLSILIILPTLAAAWTTSAVSRSDFFKATTTTGLVALVVAPEAGQAAETLPNGVTYEVVQTGKGPKPDSGELVAVRFAAYCGDIKIDDIFDTPEPYYTRVGSGGLIKGVEETIPLMQLGDRWKLTIPVRCLLRLTVFCNVC